MNSEKVVHLFELMALSIMFLSSCNPDCKEVTIQKVEWTTQYENFLIEKDTVEEVGEYVDTLVSYTVEEHRTKVEYKKDASGDLKGSTTVHYIKIKNNNDSFSNRFSIKLTGKEYLESSKRWKDLYITTNYVTISPQNTYTFSIRHPSWWRNDGNGYNENNVAIYIIQEASNVFRTSKQIKRIKQKKVKRIDNIIISDTIVNDCECDIDALKQKYTTIKETFERLKRERLIITE